MDSDGDVLVLDQRNDAVYAFRRGQLGVAIGGTVTLSSVAAFTTAPTIAITATVTGARYDTLEYAWVVNIGPGTITGTGASITYNNPNPNAVTQVRIRCTVTARGDGTNYRAGSVSVSFAEVAFLTF